jgi:hypothetical protein
MNRTALAAVAALGLLLTGCGASDSGGDSVTDPATGTAGPGDGPEVAAGADDVVLRIETGGGYVPVDYAFANGPTVLVTGDGLVLQPAPQAADAEQPRLLPYVQHTVDAATLEDVVRLADEAGLLAEPPDYFEGAPCRAPPSRSPPTARPGPTPPTPSASTPRRAGGRCSRTT